MATRGKNSWFMEKKGKKHFLWEIKVVGNETHVKAGILGGKQNSLAPFTHKSKFQAQKFAEKEVEKKIKQGFREENDSKVAVKDSNHSNKGNNRRRRGRRYQERNDAGDYVNADDDVINGPNEVDDVDDNVDVNNETYDDDTDDVVDDDYYDDDDVTYNSGDADDDAPDQDDDVYDDVSYDVEDGGSDHDTESVGSSSSFHFTLDPPGGRRPGGRGGAGWGPYTGKHPSPLNRRRSVRLAQKQEQMDTEYSPPTALLTRQSTTAVIRQQLAGATLKSGRGRLEKMDTSKEWTGWREGDIPKLQKQQTSHPKLKRKKSALPEIPEDEEAAGPSIKKKDIKDSGRLLRKQSTTASLRAMFNSTDILDSDSEGRDEPDGGGGGPGSSVTGRGARLKRKSTTILSPTAETPPKAARSDVPPKVLKSALKKQTTRVTPKRQATVSVTFTDSQEPETRQKKMKTSTLRRQATVLRGDMVHIPPLQTWPVTMPAQEVWKVPMLTSDGKPATAESLIIEQSRCIIADNTGKVLGLDGSVNPTRLQSLPLPACSVTTDDDFTYAACTSGHLYDISQSEPRLVFQALDFNKVTCMGVYNGLVAMGDDLGRLALLGHDGTAKWTEAESGKETFMVQVDDTGVYHATHGSVTKYSLLEGATMWRTDLTDVTRGTMTSSHLYVTSGFSVVKLDKFTGKTAKVYDKGGPETGELRNVCVGDQVVFAVGSTNKIVCYHESTGNVVYIASHTTAIPSSSVRYYSGRMFCAGTGGLSVFDFSQSVVEQARK